MTPSPNEVEQTLAERLEIYASASCGGPLEADLLAAAKALREREGWKLVPVEPTQAMLDAGHTAIANGDGLSIAYKAMLFHAALSAIENSGGSHE